MFSCFIMPCQIRIATFSLPTTYLTFDQLLFRFSKHVKLFPFIVLFLALFKLRCFLSLYPLWYCFASSSWWSLYSLPLSFLIYFVLSYQSVNPCFMFSSFTGMQYSLYYVGVLPATQRLHILYFVYENRPASKGLLYYDKGNSQSFLL